MDQANQVLRQIDREGNISRLAGRCVIDEAAPAGPGPCAEPVQCPADAEGRPSGKYTCGDPSIYCFPAATALPCTPGYGGDEGPATEMRMHQPFGQAATPAGRILFDPDGNLYFADTGNHLIRMVDTEGIVHRVAGQVPVDGVPQYGYAGDGGPAVDALINYPVDLALDEDGTLYFTDVNNHCVRAIDSGGIVTTVAGTCGVKGYEGDGRSPTEALLSLPFGLEVANGRLYISDTGNSVIRSVRLR
jgi:hypothetical protein